MSCCRFGHGQSSSLKFINEQPYALLPEEIIHCFCRDDPDGARRDVEDAIGSWLPSAVSFQVQHFWALYSRVEIALYRGDAAGADALWDFRRQPAVCVQVRCFFRNGHHPDPDNVQKLVLDALQGMAYKHDRHIASSNTHSYDPQRPRIEVAIE